MKNYCINECNKLVHHPHCKSVIEDGDNEEGILKEIEKNKEEIKNANEEIERLYRANNYLCERYTNLKKQDLINRNIIGKCFMDKEESEYGDYCIYFRVNSVQEVYSDMFTIKCDYFKKCKMNGENLFDFSNCVYNFNYKALENEISLEEFYQKRDEMWNEFKSYVK